MLVENRDRTSDRTKDDIADNLEWPLKVISGTIIVFIVFISKYIMYEVNYNGRTSYVSNFYRHIRLKSVNLFVTFVIMFESPRRNCDNVWSVKTKTV